VKILSNRSFIILTILITTSFLFAQTDINQNGIKTTVIYQVSASAAQAKRYEIANIGYNSFHWQDGGLIIVEIFQTRFSTDYKKYIIQNSFGEGINSGISVLKLVESYGNQHLGKISLGTSTNLSSSYSGYINKQLPIYFDVQNHAIYNIRITYTQTKVASLSSLNQIKIDEIPTGINIPNFTVSSEINNNLSMNGLLRISGNGNHYINNGNLGIGTIAPDEKLTVKGKIHTQEIKVDMSGPLVPDYVFANDYKLKSLKEVEDYIKENRHLPEIPSAKDIQKDGLLLAEMNMNLLKKIEELTLYIIEINKRIDSLEKKQK